MTQGTDRFAEAKRKQRSEFEAEAEIACGQCHSEDELALRLDNAGAKMLANYQRLHDPIWNNLISQIHAQSGEEVFSTDYRGNCVESAVADAKSAYERNLRHLQIRLPFRKRHHLENFRKHLFANFLEQQRRAAPNGDTPVGHGAPAPESQEERGKRRRDVVEPLMKRAGIRSAEAWAEKCGSSMDKNTPRDYLNGSTAKPRITTRQALARGLGIDALELPD